MRPFLALVFAISVTAHERPPSTWILLRTAHFELYSQGRDANARSALIWFEQLRTFFQQQTGLRLDNRPPIRVIAFASAKDYQPYRLRPTSDAYYVGTEARDYIVMPAIEKRDFSIAAHEYAHLILHASGVQLPPWLSEGLAELSSTVRINERGCSVGGDLPSHSQMLDRHSWMPFSEFLKPNVESQFQQDREKTRLFYAQSWILTEMLVLSPEYHKRFPVLVAALASGTPGAQALTSVYARPLDVILRDTHAWADSRGKLAAVTLFGVVTGTIVSEVSRISPSGSRLLIADLLFATGNYDRAEALYRDQAIELPSDPNVYAALGTIALRKGDTNTARRNWKQALDGGINDAGLCYRYAALAQDAGVPAIEVRPALERAIALRTDFDDARYALALLESNAGNYDRAVTQLRAMRSVAPVRAYAYWSAMSYALNELGKRDDAIAAAQQAMKHAAAPAERANAAQLVYVAQTDLTVQFTRDANGHAQLITTRVPHNTSGWNPFIEPTDRILRVAAKLREFNCSGGRATGIAVDTDHGSLTLAIPDPSRILMRNAPSEFTCGPQPANAVTVEYAVSETQDGIAGVLRGMAFSQR